MKPILTPICFLALTLGTAPCLFGQGTAFTYQGLLTRSNFNTSGSYDMTFALFNASSGGAQAGSTITNTAVSTSNGLFTVALDFGGVFTGTAYWLEIGVRSNGAGSFATLAPRQQLTPTPYAITAENLDGSLPASQLTGTLSPSLFPVPLDVSGSTAAPLLEADQGGSGIAILGSRTATTGTSAGVKGTTASTTGGANAVYGLVTSLSPGYSSTGVRGENFGTNAGNYGVWGSQAGSGIGVYGSTPAGVGVYGSTPSGIGVAGESTTGTGAYGYSSSNGFGLYGYSSSGIAIWGQSASGDGINGYSFSPNSRAVFGSHSGNGTGAGVQGTTTSTDANANAVYGLVSSTSPGFFSAGVRGVNNDTGNVGVGVYGSQAGGGWGVYGTTPSGFGVAGGSYTGTGVYGASTTSSGVEGYSSGGIGVFGIHSASNGIAPGVQGSTASKDAESFGVYGLVSSASPGSSSAGVRGQNNGTGGYGIGVWGSQAGSGWGGYFTSAAGVGVNADAGSGTGVQANGATGLRAYGSTGDGVDASSAGAIGVSGTHAGATGAAAGVQGTTASTGGGANGVYGLVTSLSSGPASTGVRGENLGTNGYGNGVWGSQAGSGWGVYGFTPSGIGVRGESPTGTGVHGESSSGSGVYGQSSSGSGVYGQSSSGSGVYAASSSGPALTIGNGAIQVSGAGVGTSTAAFIHFATTNNTCFACEHTVISNPLCDGNPNALLFVTHNANPPGHPFASAEPHLIIVYYNGANWLISFESSAPIIDHAFNVLIIKP